MKSAACLKSQIPVCFTVISANVIGNTGFLAKRIPKLNQQIESGSGVATNQLQAYRMQI